MKNGYFQDVTMNPYGMEMPGRTNSYGAGVDYRYAYNGMETDGEVSGDGNSYTTEFRQYDPRLGRWKSLDPLMAKYPSMSPYVAFNNNPVFFIDPLGLEGGPVSKTSRGDITPFCSTCGDQKPPEETTSNDWSMKSYAAQEREWSSGSFSGVGNGNETKNKSKAFDNPSKEAKKWIKAQEKAGNIAKGASIVTDKESGDVTVVFINLYKNDDDGFVVIRPKIKTFKKAFPDYMPKKLKGGKMNGHNTKKLLKTQYQGFGPFWEKRIDAFYFDLNSLEKLGKSVDAGPDFFNDLAKLQFAGSVVLERLKFSGGWFAIAQAGNELVWEQKFNEEAAEFKAILNKFMTMSDSDRASGLLLVRKMGHNGWPGSDYVEYHFYTGNGKYVGKAEL